MVKRLLMSIVIIFSLIISGCFGQDNGSDDNETKGLDNGDKDGDKNTTTNETNDDINKTSAYPVHKGIITTICWIGEEAKEKNGWVPNTRSAWDDKWLDHYGGLDDPDSSNGYHPADFTPLQNPFYFSMPYNDFTEGGRKAEVSEDDDLEE